MSFFKSSQTYPAEVAQELPEEPAEAFDAVPSLPKPRSSALISKDLVVAGCLQGEGVLQVDGTVEGEIKLKGSVTVTPSGCVKGPIEADVVRIAGRVQGNITAHSHLRLEHTGRIDGDVFSSSFVIDDGGKLNGRSTMTEAEEPAPAAREALDTESAQEDLQFGAEYQIV